MLKSLIMFMHNFSKNNPILAILVFTFILNFQVEAQIIILHTNTLKVNDSEDYFTDVFSKPRNFSSICDVGREGFFYYPKKISNGIAELHHNESNNQPLQILPIPTIGTNVAVSREDCNELALDGRNRVDTSKYHLLSYRIRNSNPTKFAILWTKENNYAIDGYSSLDGIQASSIFAPTLPNEWTIKILDLKTLAPARNPWSGFVRGLSIWPSVQQNLGGKTSLDWVKLINPNTSPTIPIDWHIDPLFSFDNNHFVKIYVSDNADGKDGQFIFSEKSKNGSTNFISGILPPGKYYFYAQLEKEYENNLITISRSNIIGPIRINAKPILSFSTPSRISGSEYFRDEVGNPIDMNDSADVTNINSPKIERGYDNGRIENGFFYATVTPDPDQNRIFTTIDTQVYFNAKIEKPINTNFYRYFCLKLQVDSKHLPRNGDVSNLNRAGWVARVRWMKRSSPFSSFGNSAAHELVESSTTYPDIENGFVTYCFDLWDPRGHEEGKPWRSNNYIDVLALDPLESVTPTNFSIDWVGMFSENYPNDNHIYTISWDLNDIDGNNTNITLYRDTDQHSFDGKKIVDLETQTNGKSSYHWDTKDVEPGSYYIYAIVEDEEGNIGKYYSSEPVMIKTGSINRAPSHVPCDFDGDEKSDYSIVRSGKSGNATIYTQKSSENSVTAVTTGNRLSDTFIDQDLDKDLVSDIQFVRTNEREIGYRWFTTLSSSPWITIAALNGVYGSIPFAAQLQGAGGTKFTSFNNGHWNYLDINKLPYSSFWGQSGDIPTPADFDGDGIDNVAVFRPSSGTWYIIMKDGTVMQKSWGLEGDYPIPGDYDGDGKDDLTLWRKSNGSWYICKSSENFNCIEPDPGIQFGLSQDFPISGDFNGDGKRDPTVFRQDNGFWYTLINGIPKAQQFGLPGDIPICTSILKQFEIQPKEQIIQVQKTTPRKPKRPRRSRR